MSDWQTGRRQLLLGGVAVAASGRTALAAPRRVESPLPPRAIPPAWTAAPVLALWPGRMPGEGQFKGGQMPAELPAAYLRDIERATLRVFRPAQPNGAAVLVIPGGGYAIVSIANEGVDIAERLVAGGTTVFVLTYRLPAEGWQARADVPLQDAQRAMRVIRAHAADYRIDPARLAVVGFSAGGHLAATLATGFAETVYRPVDAIDRLEARPAAAVLIYPVIAMEPPHGHAGSRLALLGADPDAALVARRSPHRHVTQATPPVFLVHALDDAGVLAENSLTMLAACRAAGRPVEAHLFEEGGHGFGPGVADRPSGLWLQQCQAWLTRHGIGGPS